MPTTARWVVHGVQGRSDCINYIKDLKIDEENIKVLINKKDKNSIYKELIKKVFNKINIIGEINYNNKYEKLLNNKFNNLGLILNKKERKELIRIFNEI